MYIVCKQTACCRFKWVYDVNHSSSSGITNDSLTAVLSFYQGVNVIIVSQMRETTRREHCEAFVVVVCDGKIVHGVKAGAYDCVRVKHLLRHYFFIYS